MHDERSFIPLLVVIALAFLVPITLVRIKRLRVPVVVGEILAGMLVGQSGLGLVPSEDPTLNLLAEFGFVYLMFLSGMEVDFSALTRASGAARPQRLGSGARQRLGPVSLGFVSFGLTLGLATAVGFAFSAYGLARNPWMMALVLSTTSLGVVVPVLKERQLIAGRYGQAVLISALIADFCTMLLITVVVAALSRGITAEVLLVGVLFVAFFVIYRSGFLLNRVPAVRRTLDELSHATVQIKVRLAFALMLVFVALAQVTGTEVILGAFLAGAAVALLRTPADTEVSHQLEAVGFGFFIPIFFVMVGVNFNLAALSEQAGAVLVVPALLIAGVVVKLLPVLVFRLSFTWRETMAAAALLSARLSLIIAAAAIGVRIGVLDEALGAAVILVAIVSVTAGPMLFNRLMTAPVEEAPHPIIVVGANELGLQVAEHLRAKHEDVLLVDSEQRRIDRAEEHDWKAVLGDATQPDPSLAAVLASARAVICTYSDPDRSYRVCEVARTSYGVDSVVTYVSDPSQVVRFTRLGVRAANAALDRPVLLALQAANPLAFTLLSRTDGGKDIREVVVGTSRLAGRSLRHLDLPGDVLVLAVRRNGTVLIPDGFTKLEQDDHLTLVGSTEYLEVALASLSAEDPGKR